jgi:hypothetical protein
VPVPEGWGGYNGIEVDPYYLWVFGPSGIACATHASVIKCRQGKIPRPKWISHVFDQSLWESGSPPPVNSLCPCADGTLAACLKDNHIYTADYKIEIMDRTKGWRRIVTSSWVKRGGSGPQIVKMPIPCWSLLTSLKKDLTTG